MVADVRGRYVGDNGQTSQGKRGVGDVVRHGSMRRDRGQCMAENAQGVDGQKQRSTWRRTGRGRSWGGFVIVVTGASQYVARGLSRWVVF